MVDDSKIIKMQPWLPSTFIDLFNAWDTRTWKMWEFGSGFSTPWFAQRVHTLWTMDNAPYWTNAAKNACQRKGLTNVHFYCEKRGPSYTQKISKFPDGFFDFVLVDGRDRVDCLKNAFKKTSRIIALDNGLRERYRSAVEFMDHKDWTMFKAEWTEEVVRDGKVIPVKDSWHCLYWVNNKWVKKL